MSSVTVQINEQTVSGKAGMTILELAQDLGIPIPTLCHDPHLPAAGACRICLVEEESRGVLLPSCVTTIAPGMILKTHSPRVLESRRAVIGLMLASHPESCIVCDKGNRCQLRSVAAELGLGAILLDPMPQYFPTYDSNPFFKRDMSKCILCGKCIRGDQELVVEGVLDYINRGFKARPATFQNVPLEQSACTFCGTCLSLCPTGALTETQLFHQGAIPTRTVTVCSHCGCGCSLVLETHSDRIIRVTPANDGEKGPVLCVKGHFGFNYVHSPDRLLYPLIRRNGTLEKASWEEALSTVKEGFSRIQKEWGSDRIGCLASPHLTNEELYLFQKLARAGLKTPHVDNGSRLSMAPIMTVMAKVWGQAGAMAPLHRLLEADLIWVMGGNPTESSPVLGYMVKRAVAQKGAKLTVVDPRKTKLATRADLWLQIQPGSDLALIQLLIAHLLSENLWNQGFVYSQTEGFLEWKESFLKQDLKSLRKTIGLSSQEVRRAAEGFASARGVALVLGSGVNQQLQATALVMGLMNLMLLTGQWGKPGSGLYPILKESNAQGAWDMGVLPDYLPGYHNLTDFQAVKKFEETWGVPVPPGPGLSALEMMASAQQGELKGLYLAGEDPLGTYPDRNWVEGALDRLDFLVVQDLFLSETAQKAQVVLPTAAFAEKEGTFTSLERRVQALQQAIPPPGEAKADGEIFHSLFQAFGVPQAAYAPAELFREIQGLVPSYNQINPDRLSKGPVFLPPFQPTGKPFPFLIPKIQLERLAQDPDYPFLLIWGSLVLHLGAGTRTWKDRRLKSVTPPPKLTLSLDDAQRLEIRSGDPVEICSRRGSLQVSALIEDQVLPGVVFLPLPYPELKIPGLLEAFWDPSSKGSLHKICPVKIHKIGAFE